MKRRGFLRTLMWVPFVVPLTVSIVKKLANAPIKTSRWFTQMCAGYKGSQFLETGFVYAPYIPLYKTNFIRRYAETSLNKKFYRIVRITT